MSKTIINGSNDFFDVGGTEGDVMYSFTGNCGGMSSDNVLCGKTINLSEMYESMLGDVKEFLFSGEFVSLIDKIDKSKYNTSMSQLVKAYTFKKYGITIENVYNKIHGNPTSTTFTTDIIFNKLKVKYGMAGIDWMYLYNNVNKFCTNDVEILEYLCNIILSNDIHEYFVTEYNLRMMGIVKKVKSHGSCNYIKMEWNVGGNKDIVLSDFVISHKHWWMKVTKKTYRCDIRDYDKLLNGRRVTEVFPLYCPVFSNLRMNYTGIDFDNGGKTIKKCSEIAGYSDKGETWSFASIDRIDSNKGYSYDNIRIISHYANHLKNVGNIEQMRILLRYMDEQNSYF